MFHKKRKQIVVCLAGVCIHHVLFIIERVCCTLINLLEILVLLWKFVSGVLFDRGFLALGLYKSEKS